MHTKPIPSILVALCAVVPLMMGLISAPTSAATGTPDGTDVGNLYQERSRTDHTKLSPPFSEGQDISLAANFADGVRTVTFYRKTGSGWTSIGSRTSNRKGNAYLPYTVVAGNQLLFAEADGNLETEVDTLSGEELSTTAGAPDGNDVANLYQERSRSDHTKLSPPFFEGQQISLAANFSDGVRTVTFYRKTGSGWTSIGSRTSNRKGNAYLPYTVVAGNQMLFAEANGVLETEVDTLDPVPSSALLDPHFAPAGRDGQDARAKATFDPAHDGAPAQLQVKSIKDGDWDTIETARQNSSGEVTFHISDPLEVEHEYRAMSNGIATTNAVTWAGPLLDKDTGVATVHFNSNDGESVNTRSRWFEGEFAMKAGPNFPECENEGVFKGPTKIEPAEMKGRGNYSWSFSKKSFSLKLDDSNNLCGLGKSKKWALVANHYDRSLIRNPMASWVGTKFDHLGWTPQQRPVDLYVNGSYRGSYTLIERINFEGGKLDYPELKYEDDPTDCTDPVKLTGSYLLEWDFRKGADRNYGAGRSGWVGLKEPEDEDYCSAMGSYINRYVDAADEALMGRNFTSDTSGWQKYIDIDSAVDYYLAMEFLKPVDGNMWASVYMYKPRGEKLHFGPLWDFDLAEGSARRAGNVVSPKSWYLRNNLGVSAQQTSKTWFNRLNEDPEFRAAVKQRWNEVDQDLHPSAFIAIYKTQIAESAAENYKKWNHRSKISKYQVIKSSWSADVEYVRRWLESRNRWMNSQLDNDD